MANQTLANKKIKSKDNDINSLRFISDEQLIQMAKCVRGEMRRRAQEKASRDSFLLKVKEESEIPLSDYYVECGKSSDKSLPKALRGTNLSISKRMRYLSDLLCQDWSYLWGARDERKKYCVYAHVDPREKKVPFPPQVGGPLHKPFYIGKGSINRAFYLKRNQGHGIKIRELQKLGFQDADIVKVLAQNLTESEALELEAKIIYFFGTIYEPDRCGILLNLDLSLRPEFTAIMERKNKKNEIL